MRKLILRSYQSPGDIVMLTAAVRDLHACYPGQFTTDVRTSCPDLWESNPHLTELSEDDPDVEVVDCHYPLIHSSNLPFHFVSGFSDFLNQRLDLQIRPTAFRGDIHLAAIEKQWMSQVAEITGEDTEFWIIVAGGKTDFTTKWWDPARYQAVVDYFRGRIQFVQVGESGHTHPPLKNVIDLRGKTTLRQLVRLVYHSRGVVCPVTLAMHLAPAVETRDDAARQRPCVVVAGGREPPHWEAYPHHQFLHTVGMLACCDDGGCWKSRTVPLGDGDENDLPEHLCVDPVGTLPRCMDMISAEDVVRRIEQYLSGETRRLALRVSSGLNIAGLNIANARSVSEQFLRDMKPAAGGSRGRGIVVCAGGDRYFPSAWVLVNRVRGAGCRLPIQLWHLGPEEVDDEMRALVAPLGVECVDASRVREMHPATIGGGWELKPYSILHCPFREVILLDADNVSLINPAELFTTVEYEATGALFWPDLDFFDAASNVWEIFGVPYREEPGFETGQIVLDKGRCGEALRLTLWYNEHSEFYYRHVHGDKDTFRMAFRKVGTSFAVTRYPTYRIGDVFCQHDFTGRRIFQHGFKWNMHGENRLPAGFELAEECHTYFEVLRQSWKRAALNEIHA